MGWMDRMKGGERLMERGLETDLAVVGREKQRPYLDKSSPLYH